MCASDYVSRSNALDRFRHLYNNWLDRKQPSTILVKGFGLSGKTTFLRKDVAGVLVDSSDIHRPAHKAAFIHIDYDAFDSYPTQVEVLLSVRNRLKERGFTTPCLDCGLRAYRDRIDASIFYGNDLGVLEAAANIVVSGIAFAEALARCSESLFYMALAFFQLGVAAVEANEAIDAIGEHISRPADVVELLDAVQDATISQLLVPLLASDLGSIGVRPCSDGVIRAVCIALDGIGGPLGMQEGAWELSLARATNSLVILSSRGFPGTLDNLRVIDLDFVQEGDMRRLIDSYELDLSPELGMFLLSGNEGEPVSMGLARLCLDTVADKLGTESELLGYIRRHTGGGQGVQGLVPAVVISRLARDILRVQLANLPNDVVQVIFILAWFEAVDPHWLLKRLSILQPHARALHLCRSLPYVISAREHSWYVHDLIAHLIRLECDAFTTEAMLSLLRGSVPTTASRGENANCRRIREVIVRLQSHRVLLALGPTDDSGAIGLPYATLDGGLKRWSELFESNWRSSSGSLAEYERMLRDYLDWNESMRGGGSRKQLERAERLCAAVKGLMSLVERSGLSDAELPKAKLLYATALVRRGAIGSDVYRHTAKLMYHRKSLESEVLALGIRLDLDSPTDSQLVDNVNSIAVSAYRLLGYGYSMPLHAMAYLALKGAGVTDQILEGRLLRNWATTLFACAFDIKAGSYAPPGDIAFDLDFKISGLLADAGNLCLRAAEVDSANAWGALMTRAECLLLGGDAEMAVAELNDVWAKIEEKGAIESASASRCLYLRARAKMALGGAGQLRVALDDALRAFHIRYKAGRLKTDTAKSQDLVVLIEEALRVAGQPAVKLSEDDRACLQDIAHLSERRAGIEGEEGERQLSDYESKLLEGLCERLANHLRLDRRSLYQKALRAALK